MSDIAIVAAMGSNRVIGKGLALPWRLPADMRRFKRLTWGKTVLMGRKTFASIGRPLPGRTNLVLSRDPAFEAVGCRVVGSLEEALEEGDLMVIGGASIYGQVMSKTRRLYLTVIHHAFPGDAFFPAWEEEAFTVIDREDFAPDAENPFPYTFLTLERRPSAVPS